MLRLALLCLTFSLFCTPLLAQTAAPDVNGVRLGMSLDEIKAKLGPNYTFGVAATFKDPKETLLMAGSTSASDTEDAWLFSFVEGRCAYIAHQHYFKQTDLPEGGVTRDRVYEKYGKVLFNTRSPEDINVAFLYLYDQRGEPVAGHQTGGFCIDGNTVDIRVPVQSRSTSPRKLQVLYTNPDHPCPIALEVALQSGSGNHVILSQVKLVDNPSLQKEANRWNHVLAAEAQSEHDKLVQKTRQSANPF